MLKNQETFFLNKSFKCSAISSIIKVILPLPFYNYSLSYLYWTISKEKLLISRNYKKHFISLRHCYLITAETRLSIPLHASRLMWNDYNTPITPALFAALKFILWNLCMYSYRKRPLVSHLHYELLLRLKWNPWGSYMRRAWPASILIRIFFCLLLEPLKIFEYQSLLIIHTHMKPYEIIHLHPFKSPLKA